MSLATRVARLMAWALCRGRPLLRISRIQRRIRPLHRPGPWLPGVTVVIPERARPDLLLDCLQALEVALSEVDEPWQVLVGASDAAPELYAGLAARFPFVEWRFSPRPLGYSRAIDSVLGDIRHDHAYLLNNDMRLAPDALARVLELRGNDVFSVGSQIFLADPNAPRVETGLTACGQFGEGARLFDVPPGDDISVRPHLYAGGGASLFRTAPLRDYARQSLAYEPAYWEDVEWGVRAWREGWRVLFCPASQAVHRHRATASSLFTQEELDAIFERNGRWFDLRNGTDLAPKDLAGWVGKGSFAGIMSQWLGFATATVAANERARGLPVPDAWFLSRHDIRMCFGRACTAGRPRLLCVTPFAIVPTDHGGARRTLELLTSLSGIFDIALVSDEGHVYPHFPMEQIPFVSSLWMVEGRLPWESSEDRVARNQRHCWRGLREAVRKAQQDFKPDVVLVEHAQLAPLVDMRREGERWWLDLHDVEYRVGDECSDSAEERRLHASYDHVFATTPEQLSCLEHPGRHLVPNGSAVDPQGYSPSGTDNHHVLFVGNLRYAPNLLGLRKFVETAWPQVVRHVPRARLLLAGVHPEEAELLGAVDESICCLGFRSDLQALYARAALTINPQHGILGSAVKVVESLCAGRVCITTTEGGGGWDAIACPALVTVERIEDMGPAVAALLRDESRRMAMEQPEPARMTHLLWSHQARSVARLWLDAN